MGTLRWIGFSLVLVGLACSAAGEDRPAGPQSEEAVTLAWKFSPGDQLQYALVRKDQLARMTGLLLQDRETARRSIALDCLWKVSRVEASGEAEMEVSSTRSRVKRETLKRRIRLDVRGEQEERLSRETAEEPLRKAGYSDWEVVECDPKTDQVAFDDQNYGSLSPASASALQRVLQSLADPSTAQFTPQGAITSFPLAAAIHRAFRKPDDGEDHDQPPIPTVFLLAKDPFGLESGVLRTALGDLGDQDPKLTPPNVRRLFSLALLRLPEKPVKRGESWTERVEDPRNSMGGDRQAFEFRFTYQGQEALRGTPLAKIGITGRWDARPSAGAARAPSPPLWARLFGAAPQEAQGEPGSDLRRAQGGPTLEGTAWFDPKRGRLVECVMTFRQSLGSEARYVVDRKGGFSFDSWGSLLSTITVREGVSSEDAWALPDVKEEPPPTADSLWSRYRKEYEERLRDGKYKDAEWLTANMIQLDDGNLLENFSGDTNSISTTFATCLGLTHAMMRQGRSRMMLGDAQARQGEFAKAEIAYSQALLLLSAARGSFTLEVAECMEKLGRLQQQQHQLDKAVQALETAVKVRTALCQPVGDLGVRFGQKEKEVVIESVVPDSPAAADSRLQPGAQVASIQPDGARPLLWTWCDGMDGLAEYLEGPGGTRVQLRLEQADGSEGPWITIERARPAGGPTRTLGSAEDLLAASMALANLYTASGQREKAERLLKESNALAARSTSGASSGDPGLLVQSAGLLAAKREFDKSDPLFRQAVGRLDSKADSDPEPLAAALADWAETYRLRGNFPEAARLHQRALDLRKAKFGDTHPATASSQVQLAVVALQKGELAEASAQAGRAGKSLQGKEGFHDQKARCLQVLAEVDWRQDRRREAVDALRRAMDEAELQLAQTAGGEAGRAALLAEFASVYERMVQWQAELKQWDAAYLAMERSRARVLLDQLRWYGADLLLGTTEDWDSIEHWKSFESMSGRSEDYGRYLRLCQVQKDKQYFRELHALSPAQRRQQHERLRENIQAARLALAEAEDSTPQQWKCAERLSRLQIEMRLLEASEPERRDLFFLFRDETLAEQDEYLHGLRQARRLNPEFWRSIGQKWSPAPWATIAAWVKQRQGLLMQYTVGEEGSYLLLLSPSGQVDFQRLTVDAPSARALQIEAGPLTAGKLSQVLLDAKHGLLQRLSREDSASEALPGLAGLWDVLVPPSARRMMFDASVQRVIVIPDHVLALLPFEALVTESGSHPKYLLDADRPVLYCHSATLLTNLANRARVEPEPGVEDVLSVADPAYPQTGAAPAAPQTPAAAERSLPANAILKNLPRLEHSALEAAWVKEVFGSCGILVETLVGDQATEPQVRRRAPGRRIVHFACHGLAGQGPDVPAALALTPTSPPEKPSMAVMREQFLARLPEGVRQLYLNARRSVFPLSVGNDGYEAQNRPVRPEDYDGLLTLDEICNLNLHGCELAILSACNTNLGPQQWGEGVWALSRGFLVAGARRVVATDWLVDDEAAASLISYFSSRVAKEDEADHAAALHEAKKWLRSQEKWSSPHFWGSFVLIGPN
jgi:CHAT domain-containing protein